MLFNPIFHFSVELKFAKHANARTQSVFYCYFCQRHCIIICNCLKRGQESPTLHDLLSVTVFKRDFAGIRFLSRKVAVPTLSSTIHYLLLWMWRTKGYGGCSNTSVWVINGCTSVEQLAWIRYWRCYIIGMNTYITFRKLQSYADMTNSRWKTVKPLLFVGICGKKTKTRSKTVITLKRSKEVKT